jgi:ABC-type transport system substrate-binding protein
LRQGVKWHDGKPFTAADVKCTWDLLLGKANDKLRVNPRKSQNPSLRGADNQLATRRTVVDDTPALPPTPERLRGSSAAQVARV